MEQKPFPEELPEELKCRRTMTQFQAQILNFEKEDEFIQFLLDLENLFHQPFLNINYNENEFNLSLLEYQKWVARIQFNTLDLSGFWYIAINNGWDRHGNYETSFIIKLDTNDAKNGLEITTKVIQLELERQKHGAFLDQMQKEDRRPSEIPNGKEIMHRYQFLVEEVTKLGLS